MQLASAITSAAAPAASLPSTAGDTYRRYALGIMALPGITGIGLSSAAGGIVVHAQTSELALLLDRVLADTVEGTRLIIKPSDGGQEVPADSWVRNPTNVLRSMAALPGVVDWRRMYGYSLVVEDQERVDWVRGLVSATIDGTPVRVLTRGDLP